MSTTKGYLRPFNNIVNAAMGATTIISPVTVISSLDNTGMQFDFTGSPVGYFQVQVSIDYNVDFLGNVVNVGTWTPIPLTYWNGSALTTNVSIPTSVGSPIYCDLNQMSSPYVRAVYVGASGSGTLNAYITAKEI